MITYTYDLNTNGVLILRADAKERERLKELLEDQESAGIEGEVLEPLLCNSELGWIDPFEIGALTDAPILGLRDEEGKPTVAWGYMDYQVRSFVDDLVERGEAVFVS